VEPARESEVLLSRPVSLPLVLGPLRRGGLDPTLRIGGGQVWRATRTPLGPATLHLQLVHLEPTRTRSRVTARAWGPGADCVLGGVPALLGSRDDDHDFVAHHRLIADLHRSLPGLRIGRSDAVFEALVPTILEQKVQGIAARCSYVALVRALGTPAPGPAPAGLLVPPSPNTWARAPSWTYHRAGVERRRADTIRRAAQVATRLDECAALPPIEARLRLTSLPGIGPWTAAEVALVALGDADAVSVGDYHLPHQVAYALAGEARADDARMLELLEPYRGHRGRVIRLLGCSGIQAPRFGPRLALSDIARI
jgi:3-methyladenine DNA glycosylase/8-oxoguanine DNA glycosylase